MQPLEPIAEEVESLLLRVRIVEGAERLELYSERDLELSTARGKQTLPSGAWSVTTANAQAAQRRFLVFSKTFAPNDTKQAEDYVKQWQTQGFSPELVLLGRQYAAESGEVLDNRIVWVSLAGYDTRDEALALKERLQAQNVWCWVNTQTLQEGIATFRLRNEGRRLDVTVVGSLQCRARDGVSVSNLPLTSRNLQDKKNQYTGPIEITIGSDGKMAVYERLSLEDYLKGVLPGEMPAAWPEEALKAQAVAARSDTLANLHFKHELEGFDACAKEHCRVYVAQGGRSPTCDAAVEATRGQVITDGRRVVPAVFCANCGGWTEDNETVWSGPPDPVLRGVRDAPDDAGATRMPGWEQWLKSAPPAYCRADTANYRWQRRYSVAELSAIVNRSYKVGTVRSVQLGDRGISGRLEWVKIVGTEGSVTVRKELPIRLAFGGLPSAMLWVEIDNRGDGPSAFTFVGGGRGHGVGLCQHGARGMALGGSRHAEIVEHYFTGTHLVRVR